MKNQVTGTCSECGGNVINSGRAMSGEKMPDRCTKCGATNAPELPVIKMYPAPWRTTPRPLLHTNLCPTAVDGPHLNPWGGYGGMTTSETVMRQT